MASHIVPGDTRCAANFQVKHAEIADLEARGVYVLIK